MPNYYITAEGLELGSTIDRVAHNNLTPQPSIIRFNAITSESIRFTSARPTASAHTVRSRRPLSPLKISWEGSMGEEERMNGNHLPCLLCDSP